MEVFAFEVGLELGSLLLGLVAAAYAVKHKHKDEAGLHHAEIQHLAHMASHEHGHRFQLEVLSHRDKIQAAGAGQGDRAIHDFLAEIETSSGPELRTG